MALDEPKAEDEVLTINEVLVAIEPKIKPNTDDLVLDLSGDKQGLSLMGNTGNCC
ncbi:hypothetical protein JOC85_003851 [Bacillus mesophilus]|uniref:Fe-S cluster assembly protein HesB n=1 Tax=Bacillus mesophilus TaxID=1808955 RepID=A0A6M0QBB3_9BACI|nr:hypothetical protein [Bacillus mesophilus]MBM7663025.1 hypothetical protein [Bacillus mesophilus]NEY73654.1 hypothetical protein [Bacillus mesophilus]